MLLNPRFKKLILEHELKDGAEDIIAAIEEQLEIQYPITHGTGAFYNSRRVKNTSITKLP